MLVGIGVAVECSIVVGGRKGWSKGIFIGVKEDVGAVVFVVTVDGLIEVMVGLRREGGNGLPGASIRD